jgi:membrane-associated phospholipid phosphatase
MVLLSLPPAENVLAYTQTLSPPSPRLQCSHCPRFRPLELRMLPEDDASLAPVPSAEGRLARQATKLGCLLLLAGCAALPIDLPAALWFMEKRCPAMLHKFVSLAEVVSHGLGVAAVLLLVWVLDPARRKSVIRLGTMSLGAGMIANGLKMLLARRRPYHFDYQGGPLETFGDWLPWGAGGSGYQSFLSSHGAVAAGLALGLAWLYPHGRWLFAMYGAFGVAQRLVADAHYVSDVLWGCGLGLLWGAVCLSPKLLGRLFSRFEAGPAPEREPPLDGPKTSARAKRRADSARA